MAFVDLFRMLRVAAHDILPCVLHSYTDHEYIFARSRLKLVLIKLNSMHFTVLDFVSNFYSLSLLEVKFCNFKFKCLELDTMDIIPQ